MIVDRRFLINYCGVTLFEMVITLVISSIVLITGSMFISSSVNIINQTTAQSKEINNSITLGSNNIVYTLLNNDFSNNQGSINLNKTNDSLSFVIPRPINLIGKANVQYDCNYNTKTLTRKVSGFSEEILLNNVQSCYFAINNSVNNATTILNYRITYNDNGGSIVLFNFINGPYVK